MRISTRFSKWKLKYFMKKKKKHHASPGKKKSLDKLFSRKGEEKREREKEREKAKSTTAFVATRYHSTN